MPPLRIPTIAPELDHAGLCVIAKAWLKLPNSRGGHGCQVVIDEGRAGQMGGESPDSIGFRTGDSYGSYLIECKATRADFFADRSKPHRQDPSLGMGKYRYYLCPSELIQLEELPDRWGLLWVNSRGRVIVKAGPAAQLKKNGGDHYNANPSMLDPWAHSYNAPMECAMLASLLNRVGDIDKFNAMLRESSRRQQMMSKELIELREQVRRQSMEITLHKHGISTTDPVTPVPRVKP